MDALRQLTVVRLDDRHIEELYTRLRETDSRMRRVEESLAGTLARLAAVGAGVEALTASCGVRPPSSLRLSLLALLLYFLLTLMFSNYLLIISL